MKIAGLIIGIGLTILSAISLVICFLLPTLTSNHVSKKEAMIGIIPSVIFLVIGMIIAAVFALVLMLVKKNSNETTKPEGEI